MKNHPGASFLCYLLTLHYEINYSFIVCKVCRNHIDRAAIYGIIGCSRGVLPVKFIQIGLRYVKEVRMKMWNMLNQVVLPVS